MSGRQQPENDFVRQQRADYNMYAAYNNSNQQQRPSPGQFQQQFSQQQQQHSQYGHNNQQPMPALPGAQQMTNVAPTHWQQQGLQCKVSPTFVHQLNRRKNKAAKTATRGTPKVTRCGQTMAHINQAIKDVVFRTVKFMTTDAEQVEFVKMVFKAIDFADPFPGGFEEFHRVYHAYCLHQLNDHRNYVVQQTRKEIWAYMSGHDGVPPSFSLLEAIVMRTASSNPNQAQKTLAVWYVGKLLTRVTGTVDWAKPRYYYEHLSEAHFPDKPNKKYVPPSTEALLLLICKGHIPVWKAQWDYRKLHGYDAPLPNIRIKNPIIRMNSQHSVTSTRNLLEEATNLEVGRRKLSPSLRNTVKISPMLDFWTRLRPSKRCLCWGYVPNIMSRTPISRRMRLHKTRHGPKILSPRREFRVVLAEKNEPAVSAQRVFLLHIC